jgi:hypothetical protein
MSKDAIPTINITQKDFVGKDFFRTEVILYVKLDVKIGGGGEIERGDFDIKILTPLSVCV